MRPVVVIELSENGDLYWTFNAQLVTIGQAIQIVEKVHDVMVANMNAKKEARREQRKGDVKAWHPDPIAVRMKGTMPT